ncbi:GntR family transcriptional regulator [Pseudonocardia parietis]|uniref:DNA-binding GntR family transcriptional regulator n=1 Tax=Pseudonocardia parietis TaxID=570936 RepID=A0ABS4VW06_9PSEU|nr:GntR family transcriptional regulator [Pseudonocardia parietis]MBP2368113.1 DNA-binding GntR family transcriptional regulator [Pseudonocardia parietis]
MTANGARPDGTTVYSGLRADIVAGELPPGTPLRETALAERFGVSRTPVREALRRLEQDRLLVPGVRGLEVRRVDPEEVVQIYDMRIMLEAEAARQAAAGHRTSDLLRLEGLLARDRELVEPDDAARIRTNLEFHAMLWQATHNPVLIDLLERLSVHLVHAPRSTLSVGGRWNEALGEHADLLRAVRDRDADRAAGIAAAHMNTARSLRLNLLREAAGRA